MSREYIKGEFEETRSYSRAVRVKGGTTVYLAGVVGRDAQGRDLPGDFPGQARATFDRLRDAIELVGGTLDNIVTMTVFITDSRYGDEFVKLRSEYFQLGHYPASALITISGLGHPGLLIEIQAIASLDN